MIHTAAATAAPCKCNDHPQQIAGLGFLSQPQSPNLDWKLIAIIALVAYLLFDRLTRSSDTRPRKAARYTRRSEG